MISAVSMCWIIISFTVRSIDLWQNMYFSVSGVWEAEVAFSCQSQWGDAPFVAPPALRGSSPILCLSSNWWLNLPSMLQSFPEGNSKLYFKIEISVQQRICFPAVSCGFILFYLALHYSLVPLDLFSESSVLGVTQEWCVQGVWLLKGL